MGHTTGRRIRSSAGGTYQKSAVSRPTRKRERVDSRGSLMKVLDTLATGQFAAAGLTEEFMRRSRGLKGKPLGRVIKSSVQGRKSFRSVTGHPVTGFVADVVIDPINLIPGAAILKGGKLLKIGAKATGLARVGRGVRELTEAIPAIRRAKDALGHAAIPRHLLKKYNPKRVLVLNNRFIRESDGAAVQLQEEITELMMKLEPDERVRKKIFDLLERTPIGAVDDTMPDVQKWMSEMDSLTVPQRRAFDKASDILGELEKMKVEAGLLTKDRIAGFLQAHGYRYVPRMQARKSYVLDRLLEVEEGARKGDPAVAATASLEETQRAIQFIREMDEVMPQGHVEAIRKFFTSMRGFRFMMKRSTKGPVTDLPKDIADSIEQDIAVILGAEHREVARAVASRRYMQQLDKYMTKRGLLVDDAVAHDPDVLFRALNRYNTTEESAKRVREGFRQIKGTNTPMDGKWAPASLANDIKRVHRAYTDPKFLTDYTNVFTTVQNMWKAWTLSVFPAYHSRNVISNIFNNYLAGMHMNSVKDYRMSHLLQSKAKAGTLDDTVEVFKGLTEKGLWREAMENRVVRGGQFTGELHAGMSRGLDSKNFLFRMINPATNPWVKHGYKTGATLEDNARLAHFMFKLRKGSNVRKATESVNKYLFDYKYGLTQFERKWFRDIAFPFWAWTRFNIPLQLEMMVLQPRKFVPAGKTVSALEDRFGGPEPNEIYLSDWLKRSFKVRWRYNKKSKDYQYFVLDNWWPAADVTKLFNNERAQQEILALFSPILKLPTEAFFNYNLFRKRPVEEFKGQKKRIKGSLVTGGLLAGSRFGPIGAAVGGAAGAGLQKLTGKKEIALPARMEHFLRTARIINEVDRVLEAVDKEEYLSAVVRPLVGRSYPVNFEKQREYWGYMMNRRIREAKRQRKAAERKGEADNVAVLEQQIDKLEALKKEYQ